MTGETAPRTLASPTSFQAFFDAHPDAIFVHDVTGRFVEVNRRACEYLGYTRDELLGLSVFDVEEDHQLTSSTAHWKQMRVGNTVATRGTHRREDGTRFAVDVRITAIEFDGEKCLIAAVRPVAKAHNLRELETTRGRELAAYRKLIEQSQDAIAIIDHEGRYLQQNPAHRNLLGYACQELADKTPAIHFGPATFREIVSELQKHGRHVGEYHCRTKSGLEVRIELSAFTVLGNEGEPPIYIGIKRNLDATERRRDERADQQRAELEASLRHAQKMELIGQLAAGVAHDFNNLLTPILGFAEIEMLSRGHDGATTESFQQILNAAERGKELTRQLLAFGRDQVLDKRVLDLCEQVTRAKEILRRLIPAHIDIDLTLADDVPPIRADPTQFQQVLMNLATNAGDAMPNGGRMRISIEAVEVTSDSPLIRSLGAPGTFVRLSLSDEGCGMDEATLERVFEPFFTSKHSGDGTGLGLSIVYGIVSQHGGLIQTESEPGRGTTFHIYWPPADAAAIEADAARETGDTGETVLVVEDEAQVRMLVARILRSQGYQVLIASDGNEAQRVEAEHQGPITLLLTDVVMPGPSGKELYEALAPRRPGLRVLYMSGYARDVLAKDGRLDPGISMIEKPFTASSLSLRVREVLRR